MGVRFESPVVKLTLTTTIYSGKITSYRYTKIIQASNHSSSAVLTELGHHRLIVTSDVNKHSPSPPPPYPVPKFLPHYCDIGREGREGYT